MPPFDDGHPDPLVLPPLLMILCMLIVAVPFVAGLIDWAWRRWRRKHLERILNEKHE